MPKPLPLLTPADFCCTPLVGAPLTVEQAADLAGRLKALADPTRLRTLSILLASEGMEACTCDLTEALRLSQPTVSHHLKKLTEAGLLRREQRGVWAYYSIEPETVARLRALVELGEGSRDERPAA